MALSNWRKDRPIFEEATETQPWNETRDEKVARARKLIRDADYPDDAINGSIARLLARYLGD